ncbi:hypothetical protein BKA80DRAFT_266796 [Phyllosticta citrichinensis]
MKSHARRVSDESEEEERRYEKETSHPTRNSRRATTIDAAACLRWRRNSATTSTWKIGWLDHRAGCWQKPFSQG